MLHDDDVIPIPNSHPLLACAQRAASNAQAVQRWRARYESELQERDQTIADQALRIEALEGDNATLRRLLIVYQRRLGEPRREVEPPPEFVLAWMSGAEIVEMTIDGSRIVQGLPENRGGEAMAEYWLATLERHRRRDGAAL